MKDGHYIKLTAVYFFAGLVMIYASYSLPKWLPGDFVTAMYSGSNVTLTVEQEAQIRECYTGRESFSLYLINLLSLKWGYSYALLTPVSDLILEALPWTLLLFGGAHAASMLLGFIFGVEAAWRRGGWVEKISVGCMTIIEGMPEICTGVALLIIFALFLGWFPSSGGETAYAVHSTVNRILDVGHHLILPLVTLVLAYFPGNFLLTRGSMVMVLKEQFVQTARAKGLPPARVRYAHAARNALLPMFTRFGLRIAFMITGALVVETVYSYPGMGTLLFKAIGERDLPLIQGIVLFSSLAVLFVNLALEFIYGMIDPRVRYAH